MELCSQVEKEPYGRPYKIVMKKVGRPPITERMELEVVGKIMDQLFPQLPALVVTPWKVEDGSPLLMEKQIDAAIDRVWAKAKKAPGPDGMPNNVWTIVHWSNSEILDTVFNAALKS